jgi:hypothetical protein
LKTGKLFASDVCKIIGNPNISEDFVVTRHPSIPLLKNNGSVVASITNPVIN